MEADAGPRGGRVVPKSAPHATAGRNKEKADDGPTLYVGGFPREVPRAALELHWKTMKAALPLAMSEGVEFKASANGAKGFYLKLNDASHQKRLRNSVEDSIGEFEWKDPRDGKGHLTWVKKARPLADRALASAFGQAWEALTVSFHNFEILKLILKF